MNAYKKFLILTFLFINLLNCNSDSFFVIIIPSYNNKDWYKQNLNSVFNQTYKNYRVIYIDDHSPDNTGNLVEDYLKKIDPKNKVNLIKNRERKLALYNIYDSIHSCEPTEIILCLDGDDWLAHDNVLMNLNNIYKDKNIWLTYGQYLDYPSNILGGCRALPQEIINNNLFRQYDWVTSHLRTFYAGLFHKIKKEDLLYEGRFFPMAWDLAFMYPMLEMAGQHIKFIPEILYIYNCATPINDNKVNKELQCHLFNIIRSKKSYKKLESL